MHDTAAFGKGESLHPPPDRESLSDFVRIRIGSVKTGHTCWYREECERHDGVTMSPPHVIVHIPDGYIKRMKFGAPRGN